MNLLDAAPRTLGQLNDNCEMCVMGKRYDTQLPIARHIVNRGRDQRDETLWFHCISITQKGRPKLLSTDTHYGRRGVQKEGLVLAL